jgi:hypothetical protein
MPTNQAEAQISTKNNSNELARISVGEGRKVPPWMTCLRTWTSAVRWTPPRPSLPACSAPARAAPRRSPGRARPTRGARWRRPPGRQQRQGGAGTGRPPAPSWPSSTPPPFPPHPTRSGTQIRPTSSRLGLWQD